MCGFNGHLPGVRAFKWTSVKYMSRWYVDNMMVCAMARETSGHPGETIAFDESHPTGQEVK